MYFGVETTSSCSGMETRDERLRSCLVTECWRGTIGVGTFSLLEFTTVFET